MIGAPKSFDWSFRPFVLVGYATLAVLVLGLGGWGVMARISGAVIAMGTVEVEGNRQVVQHPVGGVVTEILARDGDVVAAGDVLLRLEGVPLGTVDTDPDGAFTVRATLPRVLVEADFRFSATDRVDRSIRERTAVRVTSVGVDVLSIVGLPWHSQHIFARGFIEVPALYAHVRRRGARRARNILLGTPRNPCGTLSVRRSLFPRGARPGSYILQFDANARYIPRVHPSVRYSVSVRR